MSHPSDSSYRPLPFALVDHTPQCNRERRELARALYIQQQLRNQPTQFPFDVYGARQQAEIQRANRAIHDQAVREHEASTRDWHNLRARLEEQRPLSRRHLDAENFLAGTVGPVCSHLFGDSAPCDLPQSKVPVQDERSFKDMISSHLMEQRRLMAELRSEVRDTLQAILARLSKGTTIKDLTEHDPVTSPAATSTSVNPNEEGPSQEVKGKAKEITDSDTQEEPSASLAQVASSLSKISSVTARLETLLAAFQFPAKLDFSPALGTADVFALTYTTANAPVLAQEYALSTLFADLDNIPSFGSDVVRTARRAVVTRVDQALEELDKGVNEQRRRARAKGADPVTVPVDQPARPNDGDPSEPGNVTSKSPL
ncbi:hypothetical protein EV702DRAFT_1196345 [Suillus placidus]|uniref:BAG domain-containing protein n=1 Tax=Suillus placidus TaxID=48579 RepID=A0A9P6ZX21_9AGAM|nr:hypothetical protein EV702DRAFT_1196345 [Suillus placidus]